MVLIWRDSTPPGEYTDGIVENYDDLTDRFVVNSCQRFPGDFPPSRLQLTTEGKPTDFFFAGPMFVASGEMCEVLKEFNVDAEFFRLHTYQQGEPFDKKSFFFVNIVDAVECFDFENSEYTMTNHGAVGIETLVLDESKALGHHHLYDRTGTFATAESKR